MGVQDKIGAMLEVSLSQTMHADAVASLHLMEGKVVYDSKNYKWVSEKSEANLVNLAKQLDKISEKYGRTKEEAMMIAHTAFEAKRLNSLAKEKAAIEAKVNLLRSEAKALSQQADAAEQAGDMDKAENKRNEAAKKRAEALKEKAKGKVIHMTPSQIQAGLDLFKAMPELDGLVKTWQEMRKNTADVLVESGLWSREDADFLLENIDYVPFYREEQIEQGKGPKEFIRGLQVQARDPRMKGSMKPVNDIFDNMARWMQYSVNRSVRNKSALSLIDAAVDNGLGRKISRLKRGGNNINVWRNGKKEFYELDDPMWVDAFRGLESVAIPALNVFSKMANLLRQSVVMYPLFSVAQIPQDSFAAMFSSGLKPQYALRIPVLAVKEFLKTWTKRSATHNELRKYAAVGVKDFSSAVARLDAEITAGIKAPSGVVGKLKSGLTHFAMSADNAVRQAVYEASIDAGKTQAEALEKAFQVINFRNRGSSKSLALAGQVIPFFNAYLAAQHVAYKTITGVGISPSERNAALGTLAATTGSVMAMALIYTMMNADDDDYKNKPAAVRDRLLMIPGTGGLAVPLRMDLFTFPKVLTEHIYLLMTDKGYEDSRKMKDSMKNALANALFSPTLVPQAVKPILEVGINYDFFQGRPLVGTFQKQLELERQFTDRTSELGKIFGSTGLVSPIAADHLIRGMFGSVGGLLLYMTNPLLHNDPTVERPSLSARDALAALPGTSGFVSKEYETALKTDFYVLRDEVAKVVNTINDMKARSPDEIDKYLEKEGVEEKYALKGAMNKITERLTKVRKAITQVTNDTDMTGKEKEEAIRDLRQTERDLLEGVDVKDLRKEAKL
jgi:predicted  nucleic acid-binding Zn-ribbon protein